MGDIRFYNNAILFDKAAIAMHDDCCCEDYCDDCSVCDSTYDLTISGASGGACSGLNNTWEVTRGLEPDGCWWQGVHYVYSYGINVFFNLSCNVNDGSWIIRVNAGMTTVLEFTKSTTDCPTGVFSHSGETCGGTPTAVLA